MGTIIDVHAHAMPQEYAQCLIELGVKFPVMPPPPPGVVVRPIAPMRDTDEDLAARIALMDSAGVGAQLLSPTFAPYLKEADAAAQAARSINDALAALVARAPGRFHAYASLPLPHVEASLAELRHGLDKLGMIGVTLQTACDGRSVADPMFDPIYAELDRRSAVLFLHPNVNGLCSHLVTDWKLASAAGPTLEDVVAAMHLIVAAIPSRFPNVRIIVPHLGGALATLVARLDNQLPFFAELPEPPSVTARRLYYDTCCHGSAPAMHAAVSAFGTDRLLPGSDYPLLTLHEEYAETFAFIERIGLAPADAQAILHDNAATLFPKVSAP
ncbi:amidohydrolase family protein [Novosphingobium sp. BL-52-GroH]|uniref:amidohydrolase family protein n=1 Tax=Novosphingobium sp. BL-52-GroH TaxID=3349877 RepID=UPI00384B83E7